MLKCMSHIYSSFRLLYSTVITQNLTICTKRLTILTQYLPCLRTSHFSYRCIISQRKAEGSHENVQNALTEITLNLEVRRLCCYIKQWCWSRTCTLFKQQHCSHKCAVGSRRAEKCEGSMSVCNLYIYTQTLWGLYHAMDWIARMRSDLHPRYSYPNLKSRPTICQS